MRFLIALFIFLTSCGPDTNVHEISADSTQQKNTDSVSTASSLLEKHPLITWLRKSPVEIGCMLEQELSYRDSIYNCDFKNYKNEGDPCVNVKEYYEGLNFPAQLAKNVHPFIKELTLDFEHGELREIQITFADSILKEKVEQLFALPSKDKLPKNAMDISYGENVSSLNKPKNEKYTRWLILYGFEHMGSGDVDCGE